MAKASLPDCGFICILRAVTNSEMASILIDPNNHVPEVTPADVWEDNDGLCPAAGGTGQGLVALLPRKKPREKDPLSAPTAQTEDGLRIELKAPQRPVNDDDSQLEVKEIDGTVLRLSPEVSTVVRVPKQMSYKPRPAASSMNHPQQDVAKEWGRAYKISIRWAIGISLGVVSVIVVALMIMPLLNDSDAARPRPGQLELLLAAPEEKMDVQEAFNVLLGKQSEAAKIFRVYASAGSLEDIIPLVRDASVVAPLIRTHHRLNGLSKTWQPPADTAWNVFDNDGHPFGLLAGTLPDYSMFTAYWVISNKHLRLDWKATTGYGTATFKDLSRGQGDPAEIRGKIIPADYYTGALMEDEFRSYQFFSPDDHHSIWCYARRGDPLDTALVELCIGGDMSNNTARQTKVTLALNRGPAGALPNQWLVTSILHNEWITP